MVWLENRHCTKEVWWRLFDKHFQKVFVENTQIVVYSDWIHKSYKCLWRSVMYLCTVFFTLLSNVTVDTPVFDRHLTKKCPIMHKQFFTEFFVTLLMSKQYFSFIFDGLIFSICTSIWTWITKHLTALKKLLKINSLFAFRG